MSQTFDSKTAPVFAYRREQLEEMATDVLRIARELGASDAATEISEGQGLSITVCKGEVETIEQNRNRIVGVTIMLGKKRGNANMSDFSPAASRSTIEAAYNIARFTADSDCTGLAEEELLERHPQDLQLYHPWMIDAETAMEIARAVEAAAFAMNPKIRNSDDLSISAQHPYFVLATSRGLMDGYPYSRHLISAASIAGSGTYMQRGNRYSSKRSPDDLAAPEVIGKYAAERALARLGTRRLITRKCPVLFEAPLAAGLPDAFVQAVSDGALYRKSTLLLDALGKEVFAPHVQITEDPHILNGMGSVPFDEEGVRTQRRDVVKNGVVGGYFLSTYSVRKLGMQTTGNAGGSHNLTLFSDKTIAEDDFASMLRRMGTGLFVAELMGQGVNYVTGNYPRGASGYWVENGVIQYPVEEITTAGSLREMFHQIVVTGADALVRGTKETGSILVERMTIADE